METEFHPNDNDLEEQTISDLPSNTSSFSTPVDVDALSDEDYTLSTATDIDYDDEDASFHENYTLPTTNDFNYNDDEEYNWNPLITLDADNDSMVPFN